VVSEYEFVAELWRWTGEAAWHFVTLPHEVTDDIDETHEGSRAGFGSRRVEVTVGETTWNTSVFPDKNSASYVLPVKQSVRKSEGLVEGARVEVGLRLVVE
jgi:hypothetical protein